MKLSKFQKRALLILIGLLALVPLGLLTDAPAWGEWDLEYYQQKLGFIPAGLKSAEGVKPLLPDYSLPGMDPVVGYYISGIVGVLLLFGVYYLLYKLLKREKTDS